MKSTRQFLGALAASPRGALLLVNLWDSCAACLVQPADVKVFLEQCAARLAAVPTAGADDAFDHVAESLQLGRHRFLRLCRQDARDLAGRRLSNVVTYTTFVAHHISKSLPSVASRVPAVPPPAGASAQNRLRRDIERWTSRPDWMDAAAKLGRPHPHPGNCWVSVDDFEDARSPTPYDVRVTEADRTRDMLGLIDHPGVGAHFVRYEFEAAKAAAVAGAEMARPTFSDRGNRRFRVRAACKRGRAMAEAGWGSTVDLRRLRDRKLHPVTGRPERVTAALAIHALQPLKVTYLSGTLEAAAASASDDRDFVTMVLGRRRLHNLVGRVCRYLV